ncbi:MAG: hypothetical protein KDD44_15005, partial [Bdellovibrionales bacterium]|nr:hypothetical protein [Bdellovibrionales bacterium]
MKRLLFAILVTSAFLANLWHGPQPATADEEQAFAAGGQAVAAMAANGELADDGIGIPVPDKLVATEPG